MASKQASAPLRATGRTALALLALLAPLAPLGLDASSAHAQSSRYPAPPKDRDREQDQTSQLWEQAAEPARAPQARLLAEARRLIAGRTPAELQAAADKASAAIALRPTEPSAYFFRAVALEQLARWHECAADFRKALELDPKFTADPELRYGDNPLLGLGICLARDGHLADAEVALDRAVARTPGVQEWLRLGETRIAMGKLREGLEALVASTEASGESTPSALNSWLRALAYDRGRQTALASEAAQAAALSDRFLRQLTSPAVPFVSKADEQYLMGLGWESSNRPELALAYFRGVVMTRPDGLWTRRAREHVELLEQTAFPLDVARSGPAPLDAVVATAAVRKAMPQLVACVAALPAVAFTLRVTRSRPPATGPGIRSVPPAPGLAVTQDVAFGDPSEAALEQAERCLLPVTLKLELPPIKEPGTWHHVSFSLIAHRPQPGPAAGETSAGAPRPPPRRRR